RALPTRGPFLTPRSGERPRVPWSTATPIPGKGLPTGRERMESPARNTPHATMEPTPPVGQQGAVETPMQGTQIIPPPELRPRDTRQPERRGSLERIRQQLRPSRSTPVPASPAESQQQATPSPSGPVETPSQTQ
ncbi:MAG: hypothetical protein N2Z21_08715, partial [Candidatus Sumerlaeaceae bacterium]|nr:hypothetical protein [Candidatus Sumerlaeaceae bacterium]